MKKIYTEKHLVYLIQNLDTFVKKNLRLQNGSSGMGITKQNEEFKKKLDEIIEKSNTHKKLLKKILFQLNKQVTEKARQAEDKKKK